MAPHGNSVVEALEEVFLEAGDNFQCSCFLKASPISRENSTLFSG